MGTEVVRYLVPLLWAHHVQVWQGNEVSPKIHLVSKGCVGRLGVTAEAWCAEPSQVPSGFPHNPLQPGGGGCFEQSALMYTWPRISALTSVPV